MKEIDSPVLPPCAVLHEALDHALFRRRLDHECGNFRLAEFDKGFKAPLSANEVVGFIAIRSVFCHRDWLLEAQQGDVLDQLTKALLVAQPRIDHRNPGDRDKMNEALILFLHHATSLSETRSVISNSGSSVSNR